VADLSLYEQSVYTVKKSVRTVSLYGKKKSVRTVSLLQSDMLACLVLAVPQ